METEMRFTVLNRRTRSSIRMEMNPSDKVDDILLTAREYWQCEDVVLRRGYTLLRPGTDIGEYIGEGDLVEVLPDPFSDRRCRQIGHPSGDGQRHDLRWLAGWVRVSTWCSVRTRSRRFSTPPGGPRRAASPGRWTRTAGASSG